MKKMTCSDMGGPCDTAVYAETKKEMMDKGWEHFKTAHPDQATEVEAMSQEDKDRWQETFDKKWEDTPDMTQEEMEEMKNIIMM